MFKKHSVPVTLLLLVILLSMSACNTITARHDSDLIQWRNLSTGQNEAETRSLPVLVDFYSSDNCRRCIALDNKVYVNPEIAARINEKFIPVRVYRNRQLTSLEYALADELDSGGECILAFLDSRGEVIRTKEGLPIATMEMIEPQEYLNYMEQALQRLGSQ